MRIPLSLGKSALIDDADAALITQHRWHARWNGRQYYAGRNRSRKLGHGTITMHRVLTDAKPGQYVDHINRNSLDNRRSNLRLATKSQNAMNRRAPKTPGKTSRYKGVSWCAFTQRWKAQLQLRGRNRNLGRYDTQIAAARAYDAAASKMFGEYACLNER